MVIHDHYAGVGVAGGLAVELVGSVVVPTPWSLLPGEGVVDGRLEASDVLHRLGVYVSRAGLEIFVEGGKHLRVEDLEATDAVH